MSHPTEKRIVELVGIMLRRDLTVMEAAELRESHRFITDRGWRLGRVMNLLWMAGQTHDWAWADQLKVEYDKVMKQY